MIAKDVSSLSSRQWDDFVLSHKNGCIFHTSKWLEIISATHSEQAMKIGLYVENKLVGVIPLFVKSYFFIRVAGSPIIVEDTPYLGMVIDDEMFPDGMLALHLILKKKGINFIRIIQRKYYVNNELTQQIINIEKHTHILNLEDTEDGLWNNFTSNCRNNVRKAMKNNVVITLEESEECIDVYYDILEKLYLQQGMVHPNPKKFYRQMWQSLHGEAMNVLFAWYGGVVIACAIFVHEQDCSYYLNGASLNEYKYLNPSNLLQWEAIKMAKRRGSKMYDFVGSDIERLARFKKTFGGTLVTYSCLEWSSSSIITFLRNKYPEVKHMIGNIKSMVKRTP